MNLRIARALLQTTVITMAAASCGCAGNLPRLCLNPHDAGRWSPLAAAPDAASTLENLARAAPPGLRGQPITPHMHSYWYSDADGEVLLCHQRPGASDYCFSEVWIFARGEGEQWQLKESSWNMCTG